MSGSSGLIGSISIRWYVLMVEIVFLSGINGLYS